jgi:hypothetical protein
MVQIHGDRLTERERRRVGITKRLRRTAYFRWLYAVAQGRGTEHLMHALRQSLQPLVRFGKNLLGPVSKRVRPGARHRDRLP